MAEPACRFYTAPLRHTFTDLGTMPRRDIMGQMAHVRDHGTQLVTPVPHVQVHP